MLAGFFLVVTANIDIPSMWHDEILVAVSSSLDWRDIVRRYLMADYHPPYYALLVKAFSLVSTQDWFLKLPSLAAGVGCVAYAASLGRRMGWGYAAALMALLATNIWVVLLTRQLRPYAVSLLLMTYVFHTLAAIIGNRPRNIVLYCLANVLLVLLHYGNALVVAAQMPVLAACLRRDPRALSLRQRLGVAASLAAAALLVLPFYLNSSPMWNEPRALTARLGRLAGNLASLLTGVEAQNLSALTRDPADLAVAAALILLIGWLCVRGARRLGRANPLLLALPVTWIALPVLYIVAPQRQYGEFQAWHVLPLLPAILSLAAHGASGCKRCGTVVLCVLLLGGYTLWSNRDVLYTSSGAKGVYKDVAAAIRDDGGNATVYSLANDLSATFVSWYLDAGHGRNALADTAIDRYQPRATLCFIAGAGALPGLGEREEQAVIRRFFSGVKPLVASFPCQAALGYGDRFTLAEYRVEVEREPVISVTPGPGVQVGADPVEVLAKCLMLRKVGLRPNLGVPVGGSSDFYAYPARPGETGEIAYAFQGEDGAEGAQYRLDLSYFIRLGGEVRIRVTTPDGEVLAERRDSVAGMADKAVSLRFPARDHPRFEVRVAMTSATTPYIGVHANAHVGLKSVSASLEERSN